MHHLYLTMDPRDRLRQIDRDDFRWEQVQESMMWKGTYFIRPGSYYVCIDWVLLDMFSDWISEQITPRLAHMIDYQLAEFMRYMEDRRQTVFMKMTSHGKVAGFKQVTKMTHLFTDGGHTISVTPHTKEEMII